MTLAALWAVLVAGCSASCAFLVVYASRYPWWRTVPGRLMLADSLATFLLTFAVLVRTASGAVSEPLGWFWVVAFGLKAAADYSRIYLLAQPVTK